MSMTGVVLRPKIGVLTVNLLPGNPDGGSSTVTAVILLYAGREDFDSRCLP
jgi:hypothetical protein